MIRGVLLPIITPFDEKVRVDEQMMRQLVDFHIKAGVQGLFVLGSTGQGPAMTIEERKQTAAIALDQAKSRVPVIIHVGTADAGSAVELAEHAAAHGATHGDRAALCLFRSHRVQIIAHYKAVHKAVSLPIYIYENPKYSGIWIPPGIRRADERAGAGAQRDQSRLRPGRVARVRTADAGRIRFHWQRGFVRPGAIRRCRHDQPTDQFRAGAVRRFIHRRWIGRIIRAAVEAQKRVDTAARSSRRACANTVACRCKRSIACAASR